MNVLSVLCMLALIPYVVTALALMPRKQGKYLFRMIYASVVVGGVSALFYTSFEYVSAMEKALPDAGAGNFSTIYAFFMFLLPVTMILVLLKFLLRKCSDKLLFFITAGVNILVVAGIVLYSYFISDFNAAPSLGEFYAAGDTQPFEYFSTTLEFSLLYLPLLIGFAAAGILKFSGKVNRAIHWIVQALIAVSLIGYLAVAVISDWNFFSQFTFSDVIGYLPIIIAAFVIPGIPVFFFLRDKEEKAGSAKRPVKKA